MLYVEKSVTCAACWCKATLADKIGDDPLGPIGGQDANLASESPLGMGYMGQTGLILRWQKALGLARHSAMSVALSRDQNRGTVTTSATPQIANATPKIDSATPSG